MIFGFNIINAIPDDLALNIMAITGTKVSKYTYETPINNAIRGICVNNAMNQYYLRLIVNAGVLISGKETVDIEFVEEPDFSMLDGKFKINLAEIIGDNNAERLPPMREWILWTLVYGMDVKVNHIEDIMGVLAKTDIPKEHLQPPRIIPHYATGKIKPKFQRIYDAGSLDRKLRIYPKSDLIKSGDIDYKGTTDYISSEDSNIIRLSMIHKRSDMGYAKRVLTKFEMELGHLNSFLFPPVVTNTFINAYNDTIGNGDFYKYESAMQIIEEEVPNFQNRRSLIDLLNNINEKGTIAKAREASTNKSKFQKDLKLLRDIGINGALLDPGSKIERIRNPLDEIYRKCNIFTS